MAYLLVAHDLATVRHMADHTVVMYLGKIVERAPTAALFADVRHPYTRALFSAVLVAGQGGQAEEIELKGEVPSPLNPPVGLPLPSALPVGHAALRAAGTGAARGLARPRRGLPSVRWGVALSVSRRSRRPSGETLDDAACRRKSPSACASVETSASYDGEAMI